MSKKPYQDRTDIERIRSQWKKMTGLHTREEWSAAIVRAATSSEIAANFLIRAAFKEKSSFSPAFVNKQLRWANGIIGKFDRLLIPLYEEKSKQDLKIIKELKTLVEKINFDRNAIIHQGEFRNEEDAKIAINNSKIVTQTLIRFYKPRFSLI